MTFDLESWLVGGVYAFMLVFARVGAAFLVLPAFSEAFTPVNVRLAIALSLSLLVTPVIAPSLPDIPTRPVNLVLLAGMEVLVGLFFGLLARIVKSALDVAGFIVSIGTGLQNAITFNPALGQQTPSFSVLLTTAGLVIIFASNLHHVLIVGVLDSYMMFPVTPSVPIGDMTQTIAEFVAQSFVIGVRLAAPFLLISLVFFFAMGLIARFVTQLQVFFIALPVKIVIGFMVFALTASAILLTWLRLVDDQLSPFFPGL